MSEGFHHITLNDESSWKCCFATPFGVYRFLVLPYGLSNAPELFQEEVEKYFGDIPNVMIWFDDILVSGETEQSHDKAVLQVTQRAKQVNAVFNKDKLQYKQTQVRYVGQIFDKNGMRVDPLRIESLTKLPIPSNKEQLQRIIGSFNYVRRYVPEMAEMMAPLCRLLKKNVEWEWLPLHSEILQKLKERVTCSPALVPFDPKKKIVLQCDASKNGVGSCMFQEHGSQLKLVGCASRTMNDAELNYSQTEKKLLSIYFGTQKFHRFIYGSKVDVQTDHKPLIPIMNKNIHKIGSVRLQRLRLKLLKYELNVYYVAGKHLHFADMLSRHSLKETEHDLEMLEMVHSVSKHLPLSTSRKTELRKETAGDKVLSLVMNYIKSGWPKGDELANELKAYFQLRNELYIEAGMLFLNNKIVVPLTLREKVMGLVHKGHPGKNRSITSIKQLFYWPNMSADMTLFGKNCRICEKYAPHSYSETLLSHKIPRLRFSKVGMDIFDFRANSYLTIVDYFSHWLEILPLRNKTSAAVINAMQETFTRFGYPAEVISDNMPFTSWECKKYFENREIALITSTPHYPQSNGMAEKAVGISKQLLKKSAEEGNDFRDALLCHNNTPLSGMAVSASQILNSRRCRTSLPITTKALEPKVQTVYKQLCLKQAIMGNQFNRKARKKEVTYKSGDKVVFRTSKDAVWQKAVVVKKGKEPRSYWVKREMGNPNELLRRNTSQLKKSSTSCRSSDRKSIELLLMPPPEEKVIDNARTITAPIQGTRSRSGRLIRPPKRYDS